MRERKREERKSALEFLCTHRALYVQALSVGNRVAFTEGRTCRDDARRDVCRRFVRNAVRHNKGKRGG